jgi:hypothetical protein
VLRFHIFDIEPPSVAKVPLTVYYNIQVGKTLNLPYNFAKPAYDPMGRIGKLGGNHMCLKPTRGI